MIFYNPRILQSSYALGCLRYLRIRTIFKMADIVTWQERGIFRKILLLSKEERGVSKVHTFQSPHKLNSFLLFLIFPEFRKINLYPLIQITFKILYTYNLHFRKRNIFQDLKVLVFCNNTLCICSNGTIYKLIVIFICLN